MSEIYTPGQDFDPSKLVNSIRVLRCPGFLLEEVDGELVEHECAMRPLTSEEFRAWLPTSGLSLNSQHANPITLEGIRDWPAPRVLRRRWSEMEQRYVKAYEKTRRA